MNSVSIKYQNTTTEDKPSKPVTRQQPDNKTSYQTTKTNYTKNKMVKTSKNGSVQKTTTKRKKILQRQERAMRFSTQADHRAEMAKMMAAVKLAEDRAKVWENICLASLDDFTSAVRESNKKIVKMKRKIRDLNDLKTCLVEDMEDMSVELDTAKAECRHWQRVAHGKADNQWKERRREKVRLEEVSECFFCFFGYY